MWGYPDGDGGRINANGLPHAEMICSKIHHLSGNLMGANGPVRTAFGHVLKPKCNAVESAYRTEEVAVSMIIVRVLVAVLPQVSAAT